ncbi:MAG: hypothetical protein HKN00_01635 [Flavobacteriaceae bacterium]|nr:hypothetical protein [Bacteroidia bacterium]NNF73857.1 hypothetical protein [Flavobacteriaceae bacterium]
MSVDIFSERASWLALYSIHYNTFSQDYLASLGDPELGFDNEVKLRFT